MRIPIPIVGASYPSKSKDVSSQETKNLFPEVSPQGRENVTLRRFPGLKAFADVSKLATNRGIAKSSFPGLDDQVFTLVGPTPFSMTSAGVVSEVTFVGSEASGTEPGLLGIRGINRAVIEEVIIGASNNRLLLVTGEDPDDVWTSDSGVWVWFPNAITTILPNEINVFEEQGGIDSVSYVNSQAIYTSGTEFAVSGVTNPAASIASVDVAVAEAFPDNIRRGFIHDEYLYLFGEISREVWVNTGTGNPPFDEIQGATRKIGIAGTYAVAANEDTIFFLDNLRRPQKIIGGAFDSEMIGNPALGDEFNDYSTVSDCIVMTMSLADQNMAVFTFPIANRTWLFHEATGSWSRLTSGVGLDRHRMNGYVRVFDKHLVADHSNGQIYELDFDTFDEDGSVIQVQRDSEVIHSGLYGDLGIAPGREMWINSVEFIIETGVGLTTGQGSDPEIMFRISQDGGYNFGVERKLKIGKTGKRTIRADIYGNLANFFNGVFRIQMSDPVDFTLLSCHADVDFS